MGVVDENAILKVSLLLFYINQPFGWPPSVDSSQTGGRAERSRGGGTHFSRDRNSDTQDDSSLLKSIFNKKLKRDAPGHLVSAELPFLGAAWRGRRSNLHPAPPNN